MVFPVDSDPMMAALTRPTKKAGRTVGCVASGVRSRADVGCRSPGVTDATVIDHRTKASPRWGSAPKTRSGRVANAYELRLPDVPEVGCSHGRYQLRYFAIEGEQLPHIHATLGAQVTLLPLIRRR